VFRLQQLLYYQAHITQFNKLGDSKASKKGKKTEATNKGLLSGGIS